MSEPTAADLAADVEEWVREKVNPLSTPETRRDTAAAGRAALDALVARVDTLTRERDEALDRESGTSDAFQDANASATGYRRDRDEWRRRAKDAEAALAAALARQALVARAAREQEAEIARLERKFSDTRRALAAYRSALRSASRRR